jgi:hypothetical protein
MFCCTLHVGTGFSFFLLYLDPLDVKGRLCRPYFHQPWFNKSFIGIAIIIMEAMCLCPYKNVFMQLHYGSPFIYME